MFADNLGQNNAVAAAKIKNFFDCFKDQGKPPANPAGANP
jgi:hypothetical protein